MALFSRGQRCPLCDEPILEGPVFGTWGVWLPTDDPLWKFCDGAMHWDCYASWQHRKRFASTYFQFWVDAEGTNPFWHRAYLDENVLVTVNSLVPINAAWVHLKDAGSRIDVKLESWEAWLSAEPENSSHPVLVEAVQRIKSVLREKVPTSVRLVAGIDQSRKMAVVEQHRAAEEARRDERRQVQRQVNPHNAACDRLMIVIKKDGLACPHCGKHSNAFRLSIKQDHKSAIICTNCGWVVEPFLSS